MIQWLYPVIMNIMGNECQLYLQLYLLANPSVSVRVGCFIVYSYILYYTISLYIYYYFVDELFLYIMFDGFIYIYIYYILIILLMYKTNNTNN